MDKNKESANYIDEIKFYYKVADGFSLKYLPMFFMISAATNITLKLIFHKEITSEYTALAVTIIAIAISLLWTKMVIKIEFSVFNQRITKYRKKQALSKRGIAIVIYYLILEAIKSEEISNNIITLFSKKVVEVSFAACIIVLTISFILLLFRRTVRPARM